MQLHSHHPPPAAARLHLHSQLQQQQHQSAGAAAHPSLADVAPRKPSVTQLTLDPDPQLDPLFTFSTFTPGMHSHMHYPGLANCLEWMHDDCLMDRFARAAHLARLEDYRSARHVYSEIDGWLEEANLLARSTASSAAANGNNIGAAQQAHEWVREYSSSERAEIRAIIADNLACLAELEASMLYNDMREKVQTGYRTADGKYFNFKRSRSAASASSSSSRERSEREEFESAMSAEFVPQLWKLFKKAYDQQQSARLGAIETATNINSITAVSKHGLSAEAIGQRSEWATTPVSQIRGILQSWAVKGRASTLDGIHFKPIERSHPQQQQQPQPAQPAAHPTSMKLQQAEEARRPTSAAPQQQQQQQQLPHQRAQPSMPSHHPSVIAPVVDPMQNPAFLPMPRAPIIPALQPLPMHQSMQPPLPFIQPPPMMNLPTHPGMALVQPPNGAPLNWSWPSQIAPPMMQSRQSMVALPAIAPPPLPSNFIPMVPFAQPPSQLPNPKLAFQSLQRSQMRPPETSASPQQSSQPKAIAGSGSAAMPMEIDETPSPPADSSQAEARQDGAAQSDSTAAAASLNQEAKHESEKTSPTPPRASFIPPPTPVVHAATAMSDELPISVMDSTPISTLPADSLSLSESPCWGQSETDSPAFIALPPAPPKPAVLNAEPKLQVQRNDDEEMSSPVIKKKPSTRRRIIDDDSPESATGDESTLPAQSEVPKTPSYLARLRASPATRTSAARYQSPRVRGPAQPALDFSIYRSPVMKRPKIRREESGEDEEMEDFGENEVLLRVSVKLKKNSFAPLPPRRKKAVSTKAASTASGLPPKAPIASAAATAVGQSAADFAEMQFKSKAEAVAAKKMFDEARRVAAVAAPKSTATAPVAAAASSAPPITAASKPAASAAFEPTTSRSAALKPSSNFAAPPTGPAAPSSRSAAAPVAPKPVAAAAKLAAAAVVSAVASPAASQSSAAEELELVEKTVLDSMTGKESIVYVYQFTKRSWTRDGKRLASRDETFEQTGGSEIGSRKKARLAAPLFKSRTAVPAQRNAQTAAATSTTARNPANNPQPKAYEVSPSADDLMSP